MSHLTPEEAMGEAERPFAAGTPIGEYEVQEFIGEGGFGAVYRAVHPVIGKSAAVKVLKREYSTKPEMVARFISEARAVNQIRHKNIIDIFAFGKLDDGRQYFVMELLEGTPLDRFLAGHERMPIPHAIAMLQKLARALGAAHAAGITHRDIKPENVFLTFDEDKQVIPKLLDFGIAKLMTDNFNKHKTRSGVPMGTPLYMSPEQVHGKAVDHRSDIYSFGIMVFQLFTGQLPFNGDTMMSVMIKQVNVEAPAPTSVDPSLPALLDAPILKMLEKDPENRPASIVEAVDDLVRAAIEAGVAPVSGTPVSLDPLPSTPPNSPIRFLAKTPVKSPGEATLAALGASDTLVASEAPSMDGATGVSQPPPARSKVAVLAFGTAAIVAIGAVVYFVARAPSPPPSAAASTSTSTSSSETQGTVVSALHSEEPLVAPAMSSAPVAVASSAALPPTVKLKIKSNAEGAEIWLDKEKLGVEGQDLTLPRGDRPLVLTIKKKGFVPKPLTVTPDADIADAVVLERAAVAPKEYGNF